MDWAGASANGFWVCAKCSAFNSGLTPDFCPICGTWRAEPEPEPTPVVEEKKDDGSDDWEVPITSKKEKGKKGSVSVPIADLEPAPIADPEPAPELVPELVTEEEQYDDGAKSASTTTTKKKKKKKKEGKKFGHGKFSSRDLGPRAPSLPPPAFSAQYEDWRKETGLAFDREKR
jgi:hypothetical protein